MKSTALVVSFTAQLWRESETLAGFFRRKKILKDPDLLARYAAKLKLMNPTNRSPPFENGLWRSFSVLKSLSEFGFSEFRSDSV